MDGLVLTCDHDGRLRALHRVGAGLPGVTGKPGAPFPLLFGSDAMAGALDLFSGLRKSGRAIDHPVPSRLDAAGMLYASGLSDAEGLVLAVARVPGGLPAVMEALETLNPRLARRLAPLRSAAPEPAVPTADALFDEMTLLNNELANAQRALAKANAELAASNEQKNRLMGMLAHDLRTPLQVVVGFAEMLEQRLDGRLEATERACLERIRESSLSMRHMVEDALSLAALQAGRLRLARRPSDLAALVRRNVSMNRVLAEGKTITIELSVPEHPLPMADIDPAKLDQLLNNLLSNAIKYSDRGGRVGVALGEAPSEGVGWARLRVSDDGRGIPAAELAQLFQPFARTGRLGTEGEGTVGLGLYICRSIVEGHGGRITADSAPGRGSTFTVDLPLVASSP
ncbi:HAMP domain-containing histidine kinase [Azospirillum sp. YIM DDC1]|uniref:histidine kinase n=1 Tax=Azospirillum aestuarii TaxID=2802052 RepID=A0ABS1I8I4_9PROT|nr:HAMP domain-containing sensor histidine kinase [Azospirillum aestuarii]MBK4723370.1 HAMP domain-containing histidine kinase [Azospirillum aestuarii]TWA85999.1 phospho-acceptor domain-containing protein [Azospirillum brasilense]